MATTKKPASTRKKAPAKKASVTRARRSAHSPTSAGEKPSAAVEINREERWRMIAVAAYHKAEKRNFAPGHEVDDWLAAEREVDTLLGGAGR